MVDGAKPDTLSQSVHAAAQRLRVDSVTLEVMRAFDAAEVEAILIKGASTVRWLYPAGDARRYVDCDLLLRPGDGVKAAAQLQRLGFNPDVEAQDMPEWWQHADTWKRADQGAIVDLHRTLPGVGVDIETLWDFLSGRTETLRIGEYSIRVLPIPGRALHVALHAAQHGTRAPAALTDLELAIARADDSVWDEAAELARSLGATHALAAGLHLVPAGPPLAARLNLPPERATEVVLRASCAPSSALSFDQLAQAEGLRARVAVIRHKVVPPPTYMRKWSPRARRSRLWLGLAYLGRPIWLLARAPQGLLAWRRAQQTIRGERADRNAGSKPD